MPFTGKSPDPNPCMPFIVNIYFLISALEISVLYTLRSGLNIYNAQSSMSNLQAVMTLRLVMPFLSTSLESLVMGRVTNGFPLVTSILQHLVFKMSFHDVLFTAPSPSHGGDEKVILIFQRSPVIVVQACA